ncbi:MAG: hypothetical protein NTW48_02125 [Chloroflexi bacterium]|nr:hypothetical protein [Chloroflexota bacterium]
MAQIGYWALGIGLTMVGVGFGLQYQGEALKRSKRTQDIGKKSFNTGIAWKVMGIFIFLLGFAVIMLVSFGLIK